jgi:MoxR-like ATPase
MTAQPLRYRRLFDVANPGKRFDASRAYRLGDEPAGRYVYDEDEEERPGRIELAVNVALASGRPLLVRGLPGTGKSSLAADVAARLGWRYYEEVVSSRTQARDLQYSFDAIKRLSDAQVGGATGQRDGDDAPARGVADDAAYIKPGVLWWAFDREQASRRGLSAEELRRAKLDPAGDPADLASDDRPRPRPSARAVVLIDEIDKADPDVPNDLLVPLGSFWFTVGDTRVEAKQPPLVIITTNEERDLPRAFVRRCITLLLEPPGDARLRRIARAHYPDDPDDTTLDDILSHYRDLQKRQESAGTTQASIAEFLDAVAACKSLGAKPGDPALWRHVEELTLDKAANPQQS